MLLATRADTGPGAGMSRAGRVSRQAPPDTAKATKAATARALPRVRDEEDASERLLGKPERIIAGLRRRPQAGARRRDVLALLLHLHLDDDRADVGREDRSREP